jgi:dUTP pyrophosphatase
MSFEQPFYMLKIYLGEMISVNTRKKYINASQKRRKEMDSDHIGMIDAGVDLYVPNNITINNNTRSNKVDMGVVCSMTYHDSHGRALPCGFYLYPRSSTGSKTPLRLSNSVGVIDAGYRGNIIACFDNIDSCKLDVVNESTSYSIKSNDRVVQLCAPNIIYPIVIEIVSNTNSLDCGYKDVNTRGTGGFGSTGI